MVVRALVTLLSISFIIVGLFGCSEAPFDPNVRGEVGLRGDINLDGLSYTIADAVMFSNYFIHGLDAFPFIHETDGRYRRYGYTASIAATDANADGRTLDLADLVYMGRVVVGDVSPNPSRPMPIKYVQLLFGNNTLAVDYRSQIGAASVIFKGNVAPILLAGYMEMKVGFYDGNTHVLVWSLYGNSFSGEFLGNIGEIVSVELASAEGGRVIHSEQPMSIGLSQNYPNPFNPSTSIQFSLPVHGDYRLVIKNSHNKIVTSFSGLAEAGFHTIQWDATGNAAGFYYATLTVGDWEDSIKMMRMR